MATPKYIALLQRPDVTAEMGAAGVRVIADGWGANPDDQSVEGLVLTYPIEAITPGPSVGLITQWWSDRDPAQVLARLSELAPGYMALAWQVTEHVYKRPDERRTEGTSFGGLTLFGTARRREDFTKDAFFDYWDNTHAPISGSVPGLGGYVVSEVTAQVAGDLDIDGLLELWYPDRVTLDAAGETPQQAAAWEDVGNYARTDGHFWLTKQHVVVPPPDTGAGSLDGRTA